LTEDKVFFYVVRHLGKDGHEVYVGPFDYKFQARKYLLDETGSPNGGLVILVLTPKDSK
jgi:hypothetical protein